MPYGTLLPEVIGVLPAIALSSPFAGVPSTLKVTFCGPGGGAGSSALGFALCGQAVNISAMSSIKAAPKKACAFIFELHVFIVIPPIKYLKYSHRTGCAVTANCMRVCGANSG